MQFTDFLLKLVANDITSEQIVQENIDFQKLGVGKVSLVEKFDSPLQEEKLDYGGMQGQEDEVYRIYKSDIHGFYFRIDGINDSYGENEWKGMPYEVLPEQKEITVYKKVEDPAILSALTALDIIKILIQNDVSNADLGTGDVSWTDLPLGEVKEVKSWGGEGQGESIGTVYHFINHDVYLRIDGYYQSNYGSEWDNDPYEVFPQEKTVTVYNKK